MDQFITEKLHLTPRSQEELQDMLSNFEQKWQTKARRVYDDGRSRT
jgi:hypothetical protein